MKQDDAFENFNKAVREFGKAFIIGIAKEINAALKSDTITDFSRVEIIEALTDGICDRCGNVTDDCYCMRDD